MNSDSDIAKSAGEALSAAADIAADAITSLPTPVRQTLFGAIEKLVVSAADIPAAYLEGVAAEKRAVTAARIAITGSAKDKMITSADVPRGYAEAATLKAAQRIVGKQKNLDAVCVAAVDDANKEQLLLPRSESSAEEPKLISEDWLNVFEQEAANMGTEQMQRLFGRVLSREARDPASFSIRTVRLLSQLDNKVAQAFTTLCTCAVSLHIGGDEKPWDHRVVSFTGQAGSNSLAKYGLPFDTLCLLEEYGLITPNLNSRMEYRPAIVKDGKVFAVIQHQRKKYVLKAEKGDVETFPFSGVVLTHSGKELARIVDPLPSDNDYFKHFQEWLLERNFTLFAMT